MIALSTAPGHAQNIDLDFYRLSPRMTTKDISVILGKPLPKRCHAKGDKIEFESEEGVYTIHLDSHGHSFKMDWRQKRPVPLMTEDAFRTLAEKHKCGGGKSFEIEKNTVMFTRRTQSMIPEKTLEGFTAKFRGYDDIQLALFPSLDSGSESYLSCSIKEKSSTVRLADFCSSESILCPNRRNYQLGGGSRF
jgi:hypothetical protein